MFARLRCMRPVLKRRQHLQNVRSKSNWADGGDHATHNDLPVPEGNWNEYYSRRNMFNNIILGTGTIALIGTISMIFNSGIINFNYLPPDHYEEDPSGCDCEEHKGKKK